jgi:hypothetical protein
MLLGRLCVKAEFSTLNLACLAIAASAVKTVTSIHVFHTQSRIGDQMDTVIRQDVLGAQTTRTMKDASPIGWTKGFKFVMWNGRVACTGIDVVVQFKWLLI